MIWGTIAQGYEISLGEVNAYLREAKGFAWVCKNTAYIWLELGYFSQDECDEILNRCSKIAAGLYKFMTSRKKKEKKD